MKVTFFRSATAPETGRLYKSPIMSVSYPEAVPEAIAVADAISTFEKQMQVAHWQRLAELYELS